MDRMADTVSPLLDAQSAVKDPARASTAVFYSISNCQPGLRGVSLGNFLIKQVVEVLSQEFPRLKVFCTLSPIPGFAAWLGTLLKSPDDRAPRAARRRRSRRSRTSWAPTGTGSPPTPRAAVTRLAPLKEPLLQLCAAYLLQRGDPSEPAQDQVARFHLNNGALLERINWSADVSKKGLRESLGMMVNYLYVPRTIESNHEKFVRGEIAASRRVRLMVPRT